MHNLPWKTQKYKVSLQQVSQSKSSASTRYSYSWKNCFWDQKFLRICSNSERRPSIMYHTQPAKPRPKLEVDPASFTVLVLCSTSFSKSSFLLCRHACKPNNDVSCDGACLCLYWPSPTTPPDVDWISQAKISAQKVSNHHVFSRPTLHEKTVTALIMRGFDKWVEKRIMQGT